MEVPFTWRPTGWFQIGWSAEFPIGEVRPLRFFGQDLVAYRGEHGELHVLEGHCPTWGPTSATAAPLQVIASSARITGWVWGPDGQNRTIPYRDRPNRHPEAPGLAAE